MLIHIAPRTIKNETVPNLPFFTGINLLSSYSYSNKKRQEIKFPALPNGTDS